MAITGAGLPNPPGAPMVNPDRTITNVWYQFFVQLLARTGGGSGTDITAVEATANAALAGANASLKKVSNLSDVANKPASRTNLGLGSVALGNTQSGWANPPATGAGLRAPALDMNFTTTVSNPPTQAEMTALRNQVIAIQKLLGQFLIDAQAANVIGP